MSGAQAGVIGAFALVLLTVIVRRLLPAGTRTFQLLRRHRLAREVQQEIGSAGDYHVRVESDAATQAEESDRDSPFATPHSIDDRTWADLDLDDLFLKLDRTTSQVGRQYLYHVLRTPRFDLHTLEQRDAAATLLHDDPALAARINQALEPLSDERSAQLTYLMFGRLPARPRLAWVFTFLTIASVGLILATPVWPRAFIAWVGVCAANVLVQMFYKPRVQRFLAAIHEVPKFVRAAMMLGAVEHPELAFATHNLPANARRLGLLRRASIWLMFEPGQTNELIASVYEYINIIFLLDVNAFTYAVGALETLRPVMRATFESLGQLDAMQSIAAWRAELDHWSRPQLAENDKRLRAEHVYHPLLESPVANSIDIRDRDVLITGSNMSGKTTFVRTLGVNAVLAQTSSPPAPRSGPRRCSRCGRRSADRTASSRERATISRKRSPCGR